MSEKSLYEASLGLAPPWSVESVALDDRNGEVKVVVLLDPYAELVCPSCGSPAGRYDSRRRTWRHLDTMQFRTFVTAEVPRVKCPEHGVRQLAVPWSTERSRFTALFEAVVIDLLKMASFSAVAKFCGLSWDEVDGVQKRAVARGFERKKSSTPKRLAVDETSFQKHHEYVTIVSDMDTGTVEYVGDDRTAECLGEYFKAVEPSKVEVVAMDMWAPYIAATEQHVPDAERKIAFDRFHVAKHLGDAVDKVRKSENRALIASGDMSLKGTKYMWLRRLANVKRADLAEFAQLRKECVRVGRAWALKEAATQLWDYSVRGWAEKAWNAWLAWALRCRLEPMKRVARMIKSHLDGILNAVVLHATNAIAESINARIQKLKATACGYRNRDRFRTAIFFHLGGLDLYPRPTRAHTNP